ncbi:MAG: hypothetical protein FD168_71 [Desulfobulbaceae bacterium]|jgi:L-fuculose-phosphate aldolase|nr:MAG: hypothetical protein FD168_71 [Desulfobulbaceae bacterium]
MPVCFMVPAKTEKAGEKLNGTPGLQLIGVLHGDIKSRADAPKNFDESERVGTLEIFPEYQEGLDGIVAGQTIVVLFWLHKSTRDVLKVYPRGDKTNGLRGVFSTRSPSDPIPSPSQS